MTTAELIEILSSLDPDAPVLIMSRTGEPVDVAFVDARPMFRWGPILHSEQI